MKNGQKVVITWGMFKGQRGTIARIEGKRTFYVALETLGGLEVHLRDDHFEVETELSGQTFEQVVSALTGGDYKPNTKAFEKIRGMMVNEVKGANDGDGFVLFGDIYTRRVDGIKFEERRFCRVRKTGTTLQKKLGTGWTVTM
jgi:hypothetical protein